MAEADELALDAPVGPARILPGQLLGERADFIWDSRASRGVRVGPFPRDQAPVPGEQSARGHDPVEPQARGQQPGQGGDHGAVGPVRPGAGNLAAQDGDLLPEHQDLGVLGGALRARSASQPNSLIMSRQTRRTSMIAERNGRSQALARVWHGTR